MLIRIIQRTAVVCTQDEKTHYLRIVLLKHGTDRKKVAQRFGHLFIINTHKTIMHPVIHHLAGFALMAVCCFRLRNLVFMMGELQILPTTVDIKMLAKMVCTHG